MKHLLQRPLPDELLSSALIRTCRQAGLPIGTVTRVLTDGRKWSPGFFQASHLSNFAEPLGMLPSDLLWRHSVFPFATAFFKRDVLDKALAAALATGPAAAGMGAVTQSVSDQVRWRRFCVQCVRESQKRWGESYWRRDHNLPGVLLCLTHGAPLRQTELPTAGRRGWSYALPHEASGRPIVRGTPNWFDYELARRSTMLLERYGRTEADERSPSWYRAQLEALGLVSAHRQVSTRKLAAWCRAHIGARATRYGFEGDDGDLGWLGLMARPREAIPFVPLKHLVFETALALQPPSPSPVLDHVPTGPSGRPPDSLDSDYARALRAVIRGYIQRKERVRVADALAQAGCWSAYRHGRTLFPRTAAVVRRLRESSASVRPMTDVA